jgi:hypothetical protein
MGPDLGQMTGNSDERPLLVKDPPSRREATMLGPRLVTMFALLLAVTASVAAQPLGTDLLMVTNLCNMPNLWRLSPSGGLTSVGRIGVCGLQGMTLDVDNKNLVVVDQTPSVLRVDPVSGLVLATVWTGGEALNATLEVDQDGDYLVCGPWSLYKLKRDGSAIATLVSANIGFHSAVKDRSSGDWVIGRGVVNGHGAFTILDRSTWAVKSTLLIPVQGTTSMASDPHRTAIYAGGNCCAATAYRYEPAINMLTPLFRAAVYGMATDRSPAGDGSLIYVGDCTASTCQIRRWTRTAMSTGTVGTLPNAGINGMVFDRSRNLAPILNTPPNDRIIRLSFPGDAGRPYVLALSLSGFTPGIALSDGRVIPLSPDALTFLTASQSIPPLLAGNIGVLRATAEGVATLNVNSLGGSVKGLRVWAAALTLDPQAPLGISQISAPLLIVL